MYVLLLHSPQLVYIHMVQMCFLLMGHDPKRTYNLGEKSRDREEIGWLMVGAVLFTTLDSQ